MIFNCPNCDKKVKASNFKPGQFVKCPHCKDKIKVPGDELEPVELDDFESDIFDEEIADETSISVKDLLDEPEVAEPEAPYKRKSRSSSKMKENQKLKVKFFWRIKMKPALIILIILCLVWILPIAFAESRDMRQITIREPGELGYRQRISMHWTIYCQIKQSTESTYATVIHRLLSLNHHKNY